MPKFKQSIQSAPKPVLPELLLLMVDILKSSAYELRTEMLFLITT